MTAATPSAVLAAVLEAETPLCDRCKTAHGRKFVVGFWVCAYCRLILLQELAVEAWRGGFA